MSHLRIFYLRTGSSRGSSATNRCLRVCWIALKNEWHLLHAIFSSTVILLLRVSQVNSLFYGSWFALGYLCCTWHGISKRLSCRRTVSWMLVIQWFSLSCFATVYLTLVRSSIRVRRRTVIRAFSITVFATINLAGLNEGWWWWATLM